MDIRRLATALALILLTAFIPPEKTIRVWLIGDSTMANKEIKAYPETGWGMPFTFFFDSTVAVDNRAKNGRSTKSFIAEGRWDAVMQEMKAGDYVFIQFGHNDEVPTKGSYTPPDQFEANLIRFIRQSSDKQAIPVLITPVARRKFDSSGRIEETHAEYATIVRRVAAAERVPLIDLDKESQGLLQWLGPEESKQLFDYLTPGENPNYPAGRADDTHFNELGARKMAEIVLGDIRKLRLGLADHITGAASRSDSMRVDPARTFIDPRPFADQSGHWYAIFNKENIINALPGRPRHAPTDVAAVADNILLFQKSNGGWPKNYDVFAILTSAQKDSVLAARGESNTTFDNGTTYNQIMALATAWHVLHDERYSAAAVRGLDYILQAQYRNGGWPQYYPLKQDYSRCITVNDGAYEGIMQLLKAIVEGEPQYAFVDKARREKLAAAYNRGLDCILRLQINDMGVPTAWCQQYDERSLKPAWARKFEPPSICNGESSGIVLFLMSIDHPSERVRDAVERAVAWFEPSRLYNTRVKTIPAERMVTPFRVSVTDRVVVTDSSAPPIWTRYYELGTHRPIFCNRDSKIVYSLAEVLRERRDGYGWYTYAPQAVLDAYPAWHARWSGPPVLGAAGSGPVRRITVAADGSGDYRTVQAALDACTSNTTIVVRPGIYREKLHLDSTKDHVTLIGEDAARTILTYDDHTGKVAPNGDTINTRTSYSFRVSADDFSMRDVTVRNDAGFTAGQAVGLEVRGDRAVFRNCRIIGDQDILFLSTARCRAYFDSCYIEGTTDFIFGPAIAWFEHCAIHSKKNSYVTAASTPADHAFGFVFDDCTLTGDTSLDRVYLGRPWRPYADVIYMHCWLGRHILPEGWSNWNKTENYKTARYAEYEDRGPGANPGSRVSWSRQLTPPEAAEIKPKKVFGDWDPSGFAAGASAGESGAPAQEYSWDHLPVIQRPSFKRDTFSIVRYGAIADGITLNTKAINAAIDDCSQKGGGVVLIPAGLWVTGPIVLRSGVNLHVDRAAILQFTADKEQYPILAGNWEGHPAARCQSPISGTDLENIGITGGGIIDGNGDAWRWIARDRLTENEWKQKVASGGVVTEDGKTWFPSEQSLKGYRTKEAGVLKPGMQASDFAGIRDFLRPNLLVLTNCKKVLLEGATFQNSPAWCLHTLLCEDLTVYDVHVRNPWYAANGDGIDVESCRGVLIEHSTFDAGDDGICVKSGRDEEGRKRARPTENMIVRDDIVYRAHGGFVIGSEMSGGARNIFVSDCSFIGTDIGLRFKTVRGRGGIVEKIYVRDIAMRDIVHQAVFLDMYYFAKPPSIADVYAGKVKVDVPPVTEATPRFRDIHISHIVCDGAEEGIFVRGLPEMNIRDIYLSDMVLKADKGAELIEAQDIDLQHIRLVTRGTAPVVYVENSGDLRFQDIGYDAGAGLLFSINGDKCANIRVTDTDRSKAVHDAAFNYGAAQQALK